MAAAAVSSGGGGGVDEFSSSGPAGPVLAPEPFSEEDFVAFEPGKVRSRRLVAVVAAFAIIVVVAAGGAGFWVWRQVNPPGAPGEAVAVVVEQGMTTSELADRLQSEGVVTNATIFRWYADHDHLKLKSGTYMVRKRESMGEIVKILATAPSDTFIKVTFPEGSSVNQIAATLAKNVPRLSADKFLKAASSGQITSSLAPAGTTSLEGLLFPDTYRIYGDWDEQRVAQELVRQMEKVAEAKESINELKKNVGRDNAYDILIVASLVEREAKVNDDRAKIAAVIYNRLRKGMNLDIDATVLYAQPGEQTRVTPQLIADTADSPYNTYRNGGKLPPTPIANPGRASIYAALHPADSKWLFYVRIDSSGRHAFAETYGEHLKNIQKAKAAGVL